MPRWGLLICTSLTGNLGEPIIFSSFSVQRTLGHFIGNRMSNFKVAKGGEGESFVQSCKQVLASTLLSSINQYFLGVSITCTTDTSCNL